MRSDGVNRVHLLKCESVLCLNQSSLCGMQVISAFPSLVSRRQVFFNPLNELHADFCHTVPSQSVLGKFHIHRHLDLNHIHKDFVLKKKQKGRQTFILICSFSTIKVVVRSCISSWAWMFIRFYVHSKFYIVIDWQGADQERSTCSKIKQLSEEKYNVR